MCPFFLSYTPARGNSDEKKRNILELASPGGGGNHLPCWVLFLYIFKFRNTSGIFLSRLIVETRPRSALCFTMYYV